MYGIKTLLMKKNSFLLLATAALLFVSARATETAKPSEMVALPTYVVEAERSSPAELHVRRSLHALRELARTPIHVSLDLPALKAPMAFEAKALAGTRLAKF